MGYTNFPHGLTSFGIPVLGGGVPICLGDTYFVDYSIGNDTLFDGKSPDHPFKTFGAANDAVKTNNDDLIIIKGISGIVETSMVTLSKSRVTVFATNGNHHYGQAGKISLTATTGATNIATILNTGVRNNFYGIKFINESTVAQGLYCFADGGEYATFHNCEFYKSTDLDETTASEFLLNGDSTQFYNCTFGSLVNIIADNKIRPNVSVTATLDGKKCRDAYFENCLFLSKSAGTEHVDVYGANATDVERMLLMKNCTFVSNTLGAATPAHAVGFGALQTEGVVLLQNCTSVDHTVMAQAGVGIYVSGAVPTFATTGVAVAS